MFFLERLFPVDCRLIERLARASFSSFAYRRSLNDYQHYGLISPMSLASISRKHTAIEGDRLCRVPAAEVLGEDARTFTKRYNKASLPFIIAR